MRGVDEPMKADVDPRLCFDFGCLGHRAGGGRRACVKMWWGCRGW